MSAAGKFKKSLGSCATIALGAKYVSHYNKNEIKENMIFYTSHQGAGMVCSPYAIFTALMKSDEFDDYEHVWQINDPGEREILRKEYSGCGNVRFVGKNSAEYFDALTSAKYIISNNTLQFYFTKKPGQIYVNTWHGIPLKTLGYDIPDGKYTTRNMTRNFLMSDYIVSPCRFTTKIFKEAYKLEGLYSGKMTECGYPRNDLIFSTDRDHIIDKLSAHGTIIDESRQIILYAPTWKGTSFDRAENDVVRYDEFCDYLSEHIDMEKYQILIKPHPMVYKQLSEEDRRSGIYVSQCIDTDELLSITDILVSDYSSIFFDFLLTDRPIIFYIPDVESYKEYRGVYFGLEELPGPYSCDMGDIAEWINDIDTVRKKSAETYDKMKSWACEFDDGNASQKIIDAIFHGDDSQCRMITDFSTDKKKKILINGGSFATNGVTTSLLTMLNMLDYDKYDVTLMIIDDSRSIENIMKVNDNVRVLCRCGQIPFGVSELFKHRSIVKHGLTPEIYTDILENSAYKRNLVRCFGGSEFDVIIDYSGYGITQPLTLLQCTNAKKAIWQHNDLLLDLTNKAKRCKGVYRKKNATPIQSLVTVYDYFDEVVSCSEAIMLTNRKNLSTDETYDKFTFSTNPVDFDRIRSCCENAVYRDGMFIDCDGSEKAKEIPEPSGENVNFVTMGRYSPEKNHLNLIEGFAKLYAENDRCRLYIIGDGAMRSEYEKKISVLGLEGKVIVTGLLENPFGIMQKCGCFVLPSIYEGMGVVVYEARALRLAVIVSDFDAVDAVCVPDGQRVTGHSSDELYIAMKEFADGQLTNEYHFDPDEFNRKALAEFEAIL